MSSPPLLFVGPAYPHSPLWYLGRACRQTGTPFAAFDSWKEAGGYDFLYRSHRLLPVRLWRRILYQPRVRRMNAKLSRLVQSSAFRGVLFFRKELFAPEAIQAVKESSKAALAVWFYDDPFWQEGVTPAMQAFFRHADLALVTDRYYLPKLRRMMRGRVELLDAACDPHVHFPPPLAADEADRYGAPVCYVGHYHTAGPRRLDYLRAAAPFGLGIWGDGWERCPDARLRRCWRGGRVVGEALHKVFAASQITLNPLTEQAQDLANVRIFQAAACGAVVLTERTERVAELFQEGEEIETFTSIEEMKRKISSLLADDSLRAMLRVNVRRKVIEQHTYVHRLRRLLELLDHC